MRLSTKGRYAVMAVDNGRCMTRDLWADLGNHIHLFLSSVSLADVRAMRVPGMSGMTDRKAFTAAG